MIKDWGEEGLVYEIEGLTCHTPPVGYVYNYEEEALESVKIYRRSPNPEAQTWTRPLSLDYKIKRKKELREKRINAKFLDMELEEFRQQEWYRRKFGFWFYLNGKPTYITGLHYFYLTWWRLDTGYPQFRIPDLEYFFFLEYTVEDKDCLGMLEATKRRQGKTVRAGAFLFDYPSRKKEAHSGIQSKTYADAKDNVYGKGVLAPFKWLPDFFIPTYDMEKGRLPKSGMFFQQTNKRGAASEDMEFDNQLDSSITYKPSEQVSYDGHKLHRYVGDEVGKCLPPIDVYKRHQVVQFCLMLDEEIIGKCLYTTTVEEMESGGAAFKKLWDASKIHDRNENGRTKSGLYSYFMPAYRTMFLDKFGYPDEERARQFYMNEREGLRDDHSALASHIRKNPFTVEEMFFVDSDTCLFDSIRLNEQIQVVSHDPDNKLTQRGDLLWGEGKDSFVVFRPTLKGRFLLNVQALDLADDSEFNNVIQENGRVIPKHKRRVAGADPFDHDVTVDGRRSDGAGYVYHKDDITNEKLSNSFLCQYIYRPQKAAIFYEDMIKMCFFFGSEILIEDNKRGLINYFKNRGYQRFVVDFNGKDGISGSTKAHNHIAEELECYITDHCEKVVFVDLLTDWLLFDLNNTTKFDAAMASGYTLIAANKFKYKEKDGKQVYLSEKLIEVNDVFINY